MLNAKNCGLADYFEGRAIYIAHDMKAWEADPTMFLHAAEIEGVKPDGCLVVEDSETGIEAGLAAGMKVVFMILMKWGLNMSL